MTQKQRPFFIIIATYLTGIVFFTLFRLLLLITEAGALETIPSSEKTGLILKAFFMGFRFDSVISAYILSLPVILLIFSAIWQKTGKIFLVASKSVLTALYLISFSLCAIDLPFFHNFNTRLNMTLFAWQNTPGFVIGMVARDFSFYWSVFPLIIFSALFILIINKIFSTVSKRTTYSVWNPAHISGYILVSLIFMGLLVVGARGRLERKSPIRIGTAYFSNYGFPNMLGLNPVFTFLRSYLDSINPENEEKALMSEEKSLALVKKYLKIEGETGYNSPIARERNNNQQSERMNVVLIMMESMGIQKIGHFGNPENLTPNLDRVIGQSILFTNLYSSGIHTRTGVFSTLFSYPCFMKKHPMKTADMVKFCGIGSAFKNNQYSTIYFTTHDDQFDNIGGFLRGNDFDQLISQKDYPKEKVLSSLGVPDDFMFRFSIPYINELAGKKEPFLAVYLTCSDHGPRIIPNYYKPHQKEIEKQSVEYADWSLGEFLKDAEKQPWYKNTLFVFVADHGFESKSHYDLPYEKHQIPLIFYAPGKGKQQKELSQMGCQMDVFPTIMGYLKLPYVNNTLGINLFEEKRPYVIFTTDDKFAVMDDQYLLILRDNKVNSLYHYQEKNVTDFILEEKDKAEEMKKYAESMLQVGRDLFKKRKLDPVKKEL